ncbi:TPA: hypothetical protein HNN84_06155 [Escherichia coli]|nr:hypothetical protein [Escherichia coli]KAA2013294.1 hypothetical protein EA223_11955 [Escherichia coli]KAA2173691.1 hypothetical protein EA244_02075 [Escherichia coli]QIF70810.1 hypothetical protein EAE13_15565 [Escherichia coli]RLW92515.1 hypothetical protein EAI69_15800 [Escherichia coli]
MCCGCVRSPQSLTYVSSWGFTRLPPSCNSNYLEYIPDYFFTASSRRIYSPGPSPAPVLTTAFCF